MTKDGLPLWDGVGSRMQDEFGIAVPRVENPDIWNHASLFLPSNLTGLLYCWGKHLWKMTFFVTMMINDCKP